MVIVRVFILALIFFINLAYLKKWIWGPEMYFIAAILAGALVLLEWKS